MLFWRQLVYHLPKLPRIACDYTLFLYLFVYCGLLAPLAVLFELNFTLHLFAVFATPIVNPFTCAAGELDEVIL